MLVFEGVEDYSCKVYATKKTASVKEETAVDGPLVRRLF